MTNKTDFNITKHFQKKQDSRRIKNEHIFLCLKYGKRNYKTGICFYIILDRDIKKFNLPEKLTGLCILVGDKNVLVSVYKNHQASRNTKKLTKFNLKKNNLLTRSSYYDYQ